MSGFDERNNTPNAMAPYETTLLRFFVLSLPAPSGMLECQALFHPPSAS